MKALKNIRYMLTVHAIHLLYQAVPFFFSRYTFFSALFMSNYKLPQRKINKCANNHLKECVNYCETEVLEK